jgi:LPXTG-site transpeptidase (sortase) family protein
MNARRFAPLAAIAAVLILGLAGGFLTYRGLAHQAPAAAHKQLKTVSIIDAPAPSPSIAAAPEPSPAVATEGLRIKVPALSIDLEIIQGDGVNAPLYKAAHYPTLPWPGQGGRSLIYAHARPGMFGPLFGARVGQEVDIAEPNGTVLRYTIDKYYPSWPVTNLSILDNVNHEELVLLTCTSWNPSDPRIVAVAEPTK